MNDIRWISLKNNGGFVARIRVKGGSASYNLDKNITLGQEKTVDLADAVGKIKDGDQVYLEVVVTAGKNNKAKERFVYRKNSCNRALYSIKGTILSNKLTYNGIETKAVSQPAPVSTPVSYDEVRAISLKNNGAFVARIRVKGTHSNGGTYSYNLSKDITVGTERRVDLSDTGNVVCDGDKVTLEAVVQLGNNNVAKETFIYRKNSLCKAGYTIKGTTLNNTLTYNGIAEDVVLEPNPIDHISLKNSGAFVTRITVRGTHSDGSTYTHNFGKDITIGTNSKVSLADLGTKIKDGDVIRLEAYVVGGRNAVSREAFTYKKGVNCCAAYTISGTTLNNTLTFNKTEEVVVPVAVIEKIRCISLKNSGGFVSHIRINGTHSNGTTYSVDISKSILIGQEHTVDLLDTEGNVQIGDKVKLQVNVVAGNDNKASETFIYDPYSDVTAVYEIKGTTLSNTLLYKGVVKRSPEAPKIEKLMCDSANCYVYGLISTGLIHDNVIVERATVVNKKQSAFSVQKFISPEAGGSFIDATTKPGITYVYRAYVKTWGGLKSPTSAEKSIVCQGKMPAAPQKPLLKFETGRVLITSSVSPLATSYDFYKVVDGKSILLGSSQSVNFEDSNPQYNVLNTYYVVAKNACGISKNSPTSSIHVFKKRKALCIATSANGRSPNSCLQMSKAFERNGIHSEVIIDQTKKQLESKIDSYFSGFDQDDLAILMLYAHGGVGRIWVLRDDSGADTYITYDALRACLDRINCHKIVFISSCHSGSAIQDDELSKDGLSLLKKEELGTFDPAEFKNSVISAFQKTNSKLRKNSFTGSEYSVLCTSKSEENTFGKSSSSTTQIYGYVVDSWCKGLGWDLSYFEAASNDIVDQKADSDDNRVVTVAELSKYASDHTLTSSPFCYPEKDDTIIVSY